MDFFTEEEWQSPDYRFRDPKRIKFVIFSNISPNLSPEYKRTVSFDDDRTCDVDYKYLKENFISKFPFKIDNFKIFQNKTETEMFKKLEENFPDLNKAEESLKKLKKEPKPDQKQIDEFAKRLEKMKNNATLLQLYDCFVFIFLTFCPKGDSSKMFFHKTIVPLEQILEKLSNVPGMNGKPKIFLVQADDLKLMQEKTKTKGPTPFETIAQKIPTDADRLIITSTIPAKGFVAGDDDPSFLIQAFVEAINENIENKSGMDLLTLTVDINSRVAKLIETSKESKTAEELEKRPWDQLQLPCVTSTLRKLLYL